MSTYVKISGNIRNTKPVFVGADYFPTIIASVGVTSISDDVNIELRKAKLATETGANIITDHSLTNDLEAIHLKFAETASVPISCVSIYEAAVKSRANNNRIDELEMIKIIENQAMRGMDVITIHATAFNEDRVKIDRSNRVIPCTSRGGTMMLEILKNTKQENPYWKYFDDILKIAKKYSLTLSLGTCYRPASVCDNEEYDDLYYMEMKRMAILVKKAQEFGVGIVVEGIGHAPINKIPNILKKSKEICYGVPYRVLTVATDIALGYDHISSAIASATAVYNGADMITCVSRSEHIGLPSEDDLVEAIITARIAAHCGFSARNNDFSKDRIMSEARNNQGCYGQIDASIYPIGAKNIFMERKVGEGKSCSMCGDFCALSATDRLN